MVNTSFFLKGQCQESTYLFQRDEKTAREKRGGGEECKHELHRVSVETEPPSVWICTYI